MCEFCVFGLVRSHSIRVSDLFFVLLFTSFLFSRVSVCVRESECVCVRKHIKYPNICYRMPKETLPHIPSWMNDIHVFVAAATAAFAAAVCHTDVIARLLRIKMYSYSHRDTNVHTRTTSNDNDNSTRIQLHGFEYVCLCVRATLCMCAHTFGLSSTQLYTINIV